MAQWLSPWRSAGMGGRSAAPPAFFLLGASRWLFGWAPGLFDTAVRVGPLFVGPLAAYRLAQPLRSPRSAAVGALAYLVNPLPLAALATGRWSGLVLWALAPLLLRSVLEIQGVSPYGTTGGPAGPSVVDRSLPTRLIRTSLLVAFGLAFVPPTLLVALSLVVAVALGSVIALRPLGLGRLALAVPVVGVAALVLQGPFAVEILRAADWSWLVGPPSPVATFDSMADLLRFAPGDPGPSILAGGLLLTAAVALALGRSDRFDVAAKGWAAVVATAFVAWVDRRGWLGFSLPAAEVMLTGAAAGLSLAVATGVRSLETDLASYRFGWRQGAAVAAGVGLAVSVLGGMRSALPGDWNAPRSSYQAFVPVLASNLRADDARPVRVLWLADPAVAPFDVTVSDGGVSYGLTIGGAADVDQRWVPAPLGLTEAVGRRLDLAATGDTARLGRLLAPYGIDLVVVQPQLAPAPYEGPTFSAGAAIEDALTRQLDLRLLPGTPNLTVYRNEASAGLAASIGSTDPTIATPAAQLTAPAPVWDPAPLVVPGHGRLTVGPLEGPTIVGTSAEGWELDGEPTAVAFDGVVSLGRTETPVTLRQAGSPAYRLALFGQVLMVVAGAVLARGTLGRETER